MKANDNIAGYRLSEKISRKVWLACDNSSEVAVKLFDSSDEASRALEASARFANCPHTVLPQKAAGSALIYDYYPQRSVDALCGRACEKLAWTLLKDISEALTAIHSKGFAHNAIEPGNIMLGSDGHMYLAGMDACNDKKSPSSDVWQLGAAAFVLLMGVPVFGGRGEASQSAAAPVPTFSKGLYDDALGTLVTRCLHHDATLRPSAKDIYDVASKGLERCLVKNPARTPRKNSTDAAENTGDFWPEKMDIR